MNPKLFFDLTTPRPVVVGTGLIALDVVIDDDAEQASRVWAGGTCGNVITILSYLGWRALPVARLNGDAASECIRKDLNYWGVSLDFVSLQPSSSAPIFVQQIRKDAEGKRVHRFSRNCPKCGTWLPSYKAVLASTVHEVVERINTLEVFFLDRVSRGTLILAKESAAKGALVFFEPSSIGDPDLFREALSISHIVKYSHDRIKDLDELQSIHAPLLVIETLGRKGLRYRSKLGDFNTRGWQHLDPYEMISIQDTAGAGDWCTAGIIHALGQIGAKGLPDVTPTQLQDALFFGQALAAWNCGFLGARGGMYQVDKDTFRCQVERIMLGGKLDTSSSNLNYSSVQDIFENICSECVERKYQNKLRKTSESSTLINLTIEPSWLNISS